jgi:hypothetical protein
MAFFGVWLAGLIIIAHLLIPHDHHYESPVFGKEDACQKNDFGHPAKAPAYSFHCHGLNDLMFEKITYNFVVHQPHLTSDLFTLSLPDLVNPINSTSFVKIKDFEIPLIETAILRLSPFRAPPTLA